MIPGGSSALNAAQSLASGCPTCGAANPAAAKFCGECGTRLGADQGGCRWRALANLWTSGRVIGPGRRAAPGHRPLRRPRRIHPVRRGIATPRRCATLLTTLLRPRARDRRALRRHRREVHRRRGDGRLGHTDRARGRRRARRASGARAGRRGVRGAGRRRIQARAGVLTGEAAVTIGAIGEGMVAGDMVNTASRLQSAAPAGLGAGRRGHHASRAAGRRVRGDRRPAVQGQGRAGRRVAGAARRGGARRSRSIRRPRGALRRPGRRARACSRTCIHATSARSARRASSPITGQGGIGKSRLAWEFLKYIDGLVETVYWHRGSIARPTASGITFWALGEMVRERAGLAEGDDEATTRARIAETVARVRCRTSASVAGSRRHCSPSLASATRRPAARTQLFAAWRTFFERIAAAAHGGPGLRGPPVGRQRAARLHRPSRSNGVEACPIYILTLARPELIEARPDWGSGKRNFTSLALEPLAADAMRELLAGLVPGLPDDAASPHHRARRRGAAVRGRDRAHARGRGIASS